MTENLFSFISDNLLNYFEAACAAGADIISYAEAVLDAMGKTEIIGQACLREEPHVSGGGKWNELRKFRSWKDHQEGSHIQLKHPTKAGKVTIPHPKKSIAPKTLNNILKRAGLK